MIGCAGLVLALGVLPRPAFGQYPGSPAVPARKQLVLASGEVVPVYRIKYWRFSDGSAPALQLEYETPRSLPDTVALWERAKELWPAFGRYVEAMGLSAAIITATPPPQVDSIGIIQFDQQQHYGFVIVRDSVGNWRARGHADVMPPTEHSGPLRLIDVNGQPMPLPSAPPN